MRKIRVAAVMMSVALLFGAASCKQSSKNSKVRTVKKDDPWYESTRFQIDLELEPKAFMSSEVIECANGKVFVAYTTYNDSTGKEKTRLDIYDENGNKEKNLDLSCAGLSRIQTINSIVPSSDGKTAVMTVECFQSGFTAFFVTFDLETGRGTDAVEVLDKEGKNLASSSSIVANYPAGEYMIFVTYNNAKKSQEILNYKDKELVSTVDFSALGGIRNIDDCSYDPKTGNVAVNVVTISGDQYTCIEDPKSGELLEKRPWSKEMQNQENVIDYQYTKQGDLLRVDSLGNIFKLDPEKNTAEKVLDNSWYSPFFADFGTDYAYDINVLSFSEDLIILHTYGTNGIPAPGFYCTDTINILKKAPENPHAEKKVIEISAPLNGSFSEYMSRAICAFNNTDGEYLIRVWSKYNEGVKAGRGFKTIDPEQERLYTLVSEIHNPDGPDLVMNMQMKTTMQEGTLEDLSAYLDPETKNMLFGNILENSKVDGKLYFIPVLIEVEGLVVNEVSVDKGKTGMSFDEYTEYVENVTNGSGLYEYPFSKYNNRNAFVLSCIDLKSAIEGDKVNFDSEQFRAAAQYAKEHFQTTSFDIKADPPYSEERARPKPDGRYALLANYEDYLRACKKTTASYLIVGTPSLDSRAARFKVPESISVPCSSDVKEGAKRFINYLLMGSFITEQSSVFQGICINKDVMKQQLPLHTDYANTMLQHAIDNLYMKTDLEDEGYKFVENDWEAPFYSALENLSVYCLEDKVIESIVCDELAPFFAGDRSIDDSIKYINDRVSKYINEMK